MRHIELIDELLAIIPRSKTKNVLTGDLDKGPPLMRN